MFNNFKELLHSFTGKELVNTSMLVEVGFGSENINIHQVLEIGAEIVKIEVVGLDYRDRALMSCRYFRIKDIASISCKS